MDADPLIYDLNLDQISEMILKLDQPGYRATQIWESLYHQLNDDPTSYTNIPLTLRQEIGTKWTFSSLSKAAESFSQDNNTHKVLFETIPGDNFDTVRVWYWLCFLCHRTDGT
jgi:adenine C2-methylase RlmN of 23S rRNA A2503 and tRNA A37